MVPDTPSHTELLAATAAAQAREHQRLQPQPHQRLQPPPQPQPQSHQLQQRHQPHDVRQNMQALHRLSGGETPLVPLRPVPMRVPEPVVQEPTAKVFMLQGFQASALNGAYTSSREIAIGGKPTYWDQSKSHFIYNQVEERRWVISPRFNGQTDLLVLVQQGEMRGVAVENGGGTWQEFCNGSWYTLPVQFTKLVAESNTTPAVANGLHAALGESSLAHQPGPLRQCFEGRGQASMQVAGSRYLDVAPSDAHSAGFGRGSVAMHPVRDGADFQGRAAPSAPRRSPPAVTKPGAVTIVVAEGFLAHCLNTTYFVDLTLAIGGRSTYWDRSRLFFMYYQASDRRWALSRRELGGEDLLLDAQRGGRRGVAFEAQKGSTRWREYYNDAWHTVDVRLRKLSEVILCLLDV